MIQSRLNFEVESVGFVSAVRERTSKIAACGVSFPGRQISTFWVCKAPRALVYKNK